MLRVEQPRHLLSQLARHLRLCQDVDGGFVGRDLHEVSLDAEPGEAVAKEHARAGEAERLHRANRHEEDLIARARQVVRARRIEGRPRHDPATGLPEPADQLSQVLKRRHRHAHGPEMQNHALDPRIIGDEIEPLAQLPDAQARSGGESLPERAGRVRKRRQVLLEDEDDISRRLAQRAAHAGDQPPKVPKWKKDHAPQQGYGVADLRLLSTPRRARPSPGSGGLRRTPGRRAGDTARR